MTHLTTFVKKKMKPIIVLLVTFFVAFYFQKIKFRKNNWAWSARIAMSLMLLFTAMGHFMFTDGMAEMIPDLIPFKKEMIYITALLEILGAVAIQIPQLRATSAWLLILFFILILPANIKASIESINYQTGELDGNGITYLWFRIPIQILFIIWVYLSSIHSKWNKLK